MCFQEQLIYEFILHNSIILTIYNKPFFQNNNYDPKYLHENPMTEQTIWRISSYRHKFYSDVGPLINKYKLISVRFVLIGSRSLVSLLYL
jgi:hypothetical protein